MSETLSEMRSSREGGSDQTNQVIGNMNWLARTMQGAFEQSQLATKRSEKQSQRALDVSISAAELDQRAWLGIGPLRRDGFVSGNQFPTFYVRIINSGKTPALSVEHVNRTPYLRWVANDP